MPGAARKILIVDDDPWVGKLVEFVARDLDFEPLMARDGAEALDLFGEHLPDLTVLDVVLPKIDGLEVFHPERMASRILGMGDVLSLIEEAHRTVDVERAKKLAKKVKTGKGFDLDDFKSQIEQMRKMGGLAALVDKLPAEIARAAQGATIDEKRVARLEGIINSMTPQERAKPDLLKASRKRRIAAGAGVSVQEVNQLLNQFELTYVIPAGSISDGRLIITTTRKGVTVRGPQQMPKIG